MSDHDPQPCPREQLLPGCTGAHQDPAGWWRNPGPPLIYHLTFLNGTTVVAKMELYPNGHGFDANYHVYTGPLANDCGFLLIEPDDERALTLDFEAQAAHLFGLPKITPLQP